MKDYVSKATVTSLRYTSRASVKIKDSYYTLEACEEWALPDNLTEEEIEDERKLLWSTVNGECDNQIQEIIALFK